MRVKAPKLLREILPHFASELAMYLAELGEGRLVVQVSTLRVLRRCQCGSSGCGSFVTAEPPEEWRESETIGLWAEKGLVAVITHDGNITGVEVTDREDVQQKLGKHYPQKTARRKRKANG